MATSVIKKILREAIVLQANPTSATSTTTETSLMTQNITPKTDKVLVLAYCVLQTSANTSGIKVKVGGVDKASAATNSTSPTMVFLSGILDVTPNSEITVDLRLWAQTSSVTAAARSYNTRGLVLLDVGN